MAEGEVTWTDDDGVTHDLAAGVELHYTRCGARVTIKTYDARAVNCMACLAWVAPVSARRLIEMNRPNMQQIPRTTTKGPKGPT